ncbi:LacI family DNA-binding transcriptional regulator [Halobacillus sp. A5]|uniref:LacI family DNA-binding transcriptional regulator n=1 Tax=Halobacillus sp. A5 TaxID=2880263 RepID=UPI0020A6508C|nr:LacI family DNA-binding transcriptional regulator [Halobacillus sp. A5]MCP3028755.1 LacI family DNA-binding transcriptional regulator [Halobacillus sp. A5]
MKPKIQDVAKVAGVSPTTVSRVLNNRGYISEEMKKKVYVAMEQINYIPNDLARSLYNKKTYIIGLIVPTTKNPFFGELTAEVENYCSQQGYKALICNSLNNINKEKQYWEMLRRNQVDGVIVGTYNRGILDYDQHNLPTVAIDHYLSKNIPVVGSNNYKGGQLAVETLLAGGCKRIIHLNGPFDLKTPANLRRKAYEDVMIKHGLPYTTYEISGVFDQYEQVRIINQMFDEQPDLEGVFASDDLLALAVIREAEKRGVSIPEQLKIIGYDGTETIRTIFPGLSTICQPIKKIAESAVILLQQQMEGPKPMSHDEMSHDITLHTGNTI